MVRGKQSDSRTRQEELNRACGSADSAASAASAAPVFVPKVAPKRAAKGALLKGVAKEPTQSKVKQGCSHPRQPWSCRICVSKGTPCTHPPPKQIKCKECEEAKKCPHGRRKK